MKKTIFLISFCMALLFAGITVSAAEVQIEVNQSDNTVDIYLNDFSGEYTYSVFNNTDIADTILSDISDSAYIRLPFENMQSGEYRIVFNFNNGEILEQAFVYLSPSYYQDILAHLNNAGRPEEILEIITKNQAVIENCELFDAFITGSDTLQSETARILFNDRNWNSLYEFYVSFNKSVILAHLNNAGHPYEILEIIMENKTVISNQAVIEKRELFDAFITGSTVLQDNTVNILFNSGNWYRFDEFYYSFNQSVLLAKINTANLSREIYGLLNEYRDILDVPYEYDKLSNKQKNTVSKDLLGNNFLSLSSFTKELHDIVDRIIKNSSNTSGKFNTYICDINGEALTEAPADGTPVKISIRAAYNSEPSLTYAVAVYDNNDTLKQIELFESHATQQYEPEFYEIVTDYISDGKIKVLSLENTATFKPLDIEGIAYFNKYDKAVPQAEQEIDGIKAVKGNLITHDTTPDYFTLDVHEHRAFGYWTRLRLNKDNKIKIYSSHLLNGLYDNDTAYYLRLSGDKYIFEGTSLNDELIDFTANNIISCNDQNITILINSEEATYPLSPECQLQLNIRNNYLYYSNIIDFVNEGDHFTAQLIDGKITAINAVNYPYEKIISVSNDHILTNRCIYDVSDLIESHPRVNDIVLIYDDKCMKTVDGQKGFISEDGVLIDGKVYPIRCEVQESFTDGEPCIAYLDPRNQFVKYLDKDWDSYQTAIVTRIINNPLTNSSLITTNGTIPLPDLLILNGVFVHSESAAAELSNLPYFAISYCELNNEDVKLQINTMDTFNVSAPYSEYTNSIGEYLFDSNTKLFAYTENELIPITNLKHRFNYSAVIYTDQNDTPIYVVINDDAGATLTETKYLLVTEIDEYIISGYIDDEHVTLDDYDWNDNIFIGDILKITYFKNEIKSIKPYFSPANYGYEDYLSSDIAYSYVSKLKNNVIVLGGNAYLITEDTNIYVCSDPYNKPLSKGSINDIFCNPLNPNESNRVMIQKDNNGFVKNLVIIKW